MQCHTDVWRSVEEGLLDRAHEVWLSKEKEEKNSLKYYRMEISKEEQVTIGGAKGYAEILIQK